MLEELNQLQLAIIVFISQTGLLLFRTLNIIYTTKLMTVPATLTGIAIGVSLLFVTSIGVHSIINFHVLPIISYVLGGAFGTIIGIEREKRKNKSKKD